MNKYDIEERIDVFDPLLMALMMDQIRKFISIQTSTAYLCKRLALITVCVFFIGVTVVATIETSLWDSYYLTKIIVFAINGSNEWVISQLLTCVWISSLTSIAIHFVGLYGVYWEDYWFSITYSVFLTMGAIGSILSFSSWFEIITVWMICGLYYSYIFDLRRLRTIAEKSIYLFEKILPLICAINGINLSEEAKNLFFNLSFGYIDVVSTKSCLKSEHYHMIFSVECEDTPDVRPIGSRRQKPRKQRKRRIN